MPFLNNCLRKCQWICLVVFLVSCDSGDIYPTDASEDEGVSIDAAFDFQGIATFPVNYDILFGVYDKESEVPLISKNISKPSGTGPVNVSLSRIPDNAAFIRLCLAQAGRKTVYVFYEMKLDAVPGDDIVIPEQTIALNSFKRIQQQVFRQCIACHGGSGHAAAGLFLTAGQSYSQLVDVPSVESPKKRVDPSNVPGSFLIDVLTKDLDLSYSHNTSISSLKDDDVVLLEEWISAGTKNN